jgi:LemA protein
VVDVSAEDLAWWAGGWGPWLSASFAALVGFWMLGAYNRLMRLRNAVIQAWQPVEAQLQRRATALPELVAALRSPLASEHRALDAVLAQQAQVVASTARLKAKPLLEEAAQALVAAMSGLDASLARVLALMEQHAELRGEASLATLRRELHDTDLRLAMARQNFNDAAESHDTAVLEWPTQALARLYGLAAAGRL